MIDFRMDTFIMVCKTMNFTKAAAALNITQPAVSQHIRYLEEEYQCKLFRQTGKRMRLTKAGSMLLDAVITMKHDEQHLKRAILETDGASWHLNFGVTLTVGEFLIPYRVASYLKNKKPMEVSMLVANTNTLLERLNEGKIDFAIVEGYFAKNKYDYEIFQKEEFIPVCAANHAFLTVPDHIEDLLGETVVIREPESGNREILERYLEGRNLSVNDFSNKMEISNIQAIKVMVEQDCGIAFLYKATVRKELEEGKLREIPLKDFQILHDVTFLWRKGSLYSEHYRKLYRELKE